MANEFFPSIGSVAEQTDLLHDEDDGKIIPVGTESQEHDEDRPLQEVPSLCMACGMEGTTRMLLTSIPYFREVIVMSFSCPHCGNSNNEIQPAGSIRDQGIVYTAKVLIREDLDRQIVKSATATVVIPEFELTIPPSRGQLTTVEGLIRDVAKDLSADQPLRRIQDDATYTKIQKIVDTLNEVILDTDEDDDNDPATAAVPSKEKEDKVAHPFTVRLDDPAGTSWIEFIGSMADPKWNMRQYQRTRENNIALGLASLDDDNTTGQTQAVNSTEEEKADANEEVYVFPGVCSSCGVHLDTRMKKVTIPYFKDILIMSTNCDACGYRDNEVKSGAAISDQGKRITLKVEDRDDLSRDILKSETCGLTIPEIDLVLHGGTLGGRFTTIEGILEQIYDELSEKVFMTGDSEETDAGFPKFLKNLKEVKALERPFTIILDDPLANSYLQNLYAPDPDPNMTIEFYDRTFDQNEELGLNDIKVEGYEAEDKKPEGNVDVEAKEDAL